MSQALVGIIGGSGLYQMDALEGLAAVDRVSRSHLRYQCL